jgi:hypothetical protein
MISRRQRLFVAEFLADPKRNAAEAARKAGYSPSSAAVVACRNLQDPKIQELIDEKLTKHLKELDVDARFVLEHVVNCIAEAKQCGPGAWQSIAILRGCELLGRSMGMFVDKVEVGTDQKIVEMLNAGRKRAAQLEQNDREEEEEEQPAPQEQKEEQKPN